MQSYLLTTVDNPYDPVNDFDRWYDYDVRKGHDTCGKIASLAYTSASTVGAEDQRNINAAIDDLIRHDIDVALSNGLQPKYRRIVIDE